MRKRTYQRFVHHEARFRICCERIDAVKREIMNQRRILEAYIRRNPGFRAALEPIPAAADAPEVVLMMARAADLVGVGPMAAVAGAMAQLAAKAGLAAGAPEAIVENGGDIYLAAADTTMVGISTGETPLGCSLAFRIEAEDTPVSVCSSSGTMGHSLSFGNCDLATVVAGDGALADAAATLAGNLVKTAADIDAALKTVHRIEGVRGVLIVKSGRVGLIGDLPELVRAGGSAAGCDCC